MFRSGDVVVAEIVGAVDTKRRPCVVVSTDAYHASRPDMILGILTTKITRASTPVDYQLQDWSGTGLRQPSVFRCYLQTMPATLITLIGHCSDRDWSEIQTRLARAIAAGTKSAGSEA